MNKWYSNLNNYNDIIVASRIRLLRNIEGYPFPTKMTREEKEICNQKFLSQCNMLEHVEQMRFEGCELKEFSNQHKTALKERQLINKTVLDGNWPMGFIVSEDESVSIVLNADDHLRIQVSQTGLCLEECFQRISRIDDAINEKYCYAFDETFGYMTSSSANVGTGMRAYLILHLPLLSLSKKWERLIEQMGQQGIALKQGLGEEQESLGGLFVLYNKKTLGVSEEDIIDIVKKSAMQLAKEEKELRQSTKKNYKIGIVDGVYKAYGILKYAQTLTEKECCMYLSKLRLGLCENIISLQEPVSIYEWMLKIQPCNLQVHYDRPMNEEDINKARATYIRKLIPDLEFMI